MLEFLSDNIIVLFDGRVFQQTIGIPIGTHCAPLLADLLQRAYEADFYQWLLKNKVRPLSVLCTQV
jgi:N-formylglutamate amidohydrolase